MRRHVGYAAGGRVHTQTGETRGRPEPPAEALPLDWPEDRLALPYLDARGDLVIPMSCPVRYRWWRAGGQPPSATVEDIRAGRLEPGPDPGAWRAEPWGRR